LRQKQAAIDDYNQAIRLDPNYAKAHYNRGNAHSALEEKHFFKLSHKALSEKLRGLP
jgi:tetratricopeptide (TPR) repeat protein